MPTMKQLERWMGTGQAAKRLGRSRQGTINLVLDGHLRAVKTGAGWLYDPDDVERLAEDFEGAAAIRESRESGEELIPWERAKEEIARERANS